MNELQVFENAEFGTIRTVQNGNEIYFVASDICKALDLSNPTMAMERIDEDEKSKLNLGLSGGATNCVNEYGLYNLVLASRKREAKEFRRWVTHEVLPSIRKHGAYMTEQTLEKALTSPDFLIQLATRLKDEQERNKALKAENEALALETVEMSHTISQMEPKVNYVDKILQSKSTVLVTQIAQDYGMSAKKFNKILCQLGVQRYVGGQWILYGKYQGQGYVHSKTIEFTRANGQLDTKMQTEWTQKGRLFLYELLKDHGIYPLIEKAA